MVNNEQIKVGQRRRYILNLHHAQATPITVPKGGSFASVNDSISFSRKGVTINGTVTTVRELSVLVEISPSDARYLQIDNTLTVVNHKNYKISAKQQA